MLNRSQIVLLIFIVLLIGAMAGFAISEYFSLKVDSGKNQVQNSQAPTKQSNIAPPKILNNTPDLRRPDSLESSDDLAPDKVLIEQKQKNPSIMEANKPSILSETSNNLKASLVVKAEARKLTEPVVNIIPKNLFREVDKSSQTVHSSAELSAATASKIRPAYNYSGEDSIGPDGKIVLDGDEYTVNPRPLKRKKTSDYNNGSKPETYTYYRESNTKNQPEIEKNAAAKSLEPIVSFIGTLLNGKANGYGVGTYANGNSYKGNWVNNSKEGYGTFIYRNGDEYRGNFKNDMRNGYGRVYNRVGQVVQEGYWENDKYLK